LALSRFPQQTVFVPTLSHLLGTWPVSRWISNRTTQAVDGGRGSAHCWNSAPAEEAGCSPGCLGDPREARQRRGGGLGVVWHTVVAAAPIGGEEAELVNGDSRRVGIIWGQTLRRGEEREAVGAETRYVADMGKGAPSPYRFQILTGTALPENLTQFRAAVFVVRR